MKINNFFLWIITVVILLPFAFYFGKLGLSALVFVMGVPVVIAKLNINNNYKDFFGYGITVLLLLPITYFVLDIYTCTGLMCSLLPMIYSRDFGILAIIFFTVFVLSRDNIDNKKI